MMTSREIVDAAMSQISDSELRNLIDCELGGVKFETHDLRLALAADLLCDAALQVISKESGQPTITKVVSLNSETERELTELAIFKDLNRFYYDQRVTHEELQALLLRSSVTNAIAQALESGASLEDISGGSIRLTSIRLAGLLQSHSKPKGLFARVFGRA